MSWSPGFSVPPPNESTGGSGLTPEELAALATDEELAAAILNAAGDVVPRPSSTPVAGQVLSATDDDPLTTDWIDPPEGGGNSFVIVGTGASPITDPDEPRPVTDLPVYWMMDNGVTPTNAADGDLIWNADA